MKSRKGTVLFIFFFLIAIGCVPAIQTVYEIRSNNPVNILTVFKDTFIEPMRTAQKKKDYLKKLNMQISCIDNQISLKAKDIGAIEENIEDAVFTVQDLRNVYVSVNRYISDTVRNKNRYLDSIETSLECLQKNLDIKDIFKSENKKICKLIKRLEKDQKESMLSKITLPIKALFTHTLFNTEYLRKFEKDIEKSSVIENKVRPAFQFLRFRLLHDYGEKVIKGRNGWLFYKKDVEYLYKKPVVEKKENEYISNTEDSPISVITDFKNQLQDYGIDLMVVIVPGKPGIYPDLIVPESTKQNNDSVSHTIEFIKILREKNGVNVVDLFSPLHDERKKDYMYGDSIYLKKDTHWKGRAIRRAAQVTADEIRKFDWYKEQHEKREYIIDSVFVNREGDIGKMTRLSDFKIADFSFKPEKTLCYQVFSVLRDSCGEIESKKIYHDEYYRSRILVLGDSFSRIFQTDAPRGGGWIAHLAYELSEPMASIVNDGGASTIVRQTLSRKLNLLKNKKLVIWEFVERDLRFGAQGWKHVSIKD